MAAKKKAPSKKAAPRKAKAPALGFDQTADRNGLPCYAVKRKGEGIGFVFRDLEVSSVRGENVEKPYRETVQRDDSRWRFTAGASAYQGVSGDSFPTRDAAAKALASVV